MLETGQHEKHSRDGSGLHCSLLPGAAVCRGRSLASLKTTTGTCELQDSAKAMSSAFQSKKPGWPQRREGHNSGHSAIVQEQAIVSPGGCWLKAYVDGSARQGEMERKHCKVFTHICQQALASLPHYLGCGFCMGRSLASLKTQLAHANYKTRPKQ